MNARMKLAIAIGAATIVIPLTQAVAGIDIEAGDWKIDFSGNVNAFYVGSSCGTPALPDAVGAGANPVSGGLACTGDNATSVRNGLLPAALVFSATTRQDNFDIDVTIGLYPGINSDLGGSSVNGTGNPSALQSPGIDARQIYFTFGDASWGTVKMGRDIGLFAKDAILDDMTLLGVGTALANPAPSNTSLGRIGLGYIYTDWQPQITYTTAKYSGFSASVGVFQPLDSGEYTSHSSPQFQAGASFAWGDPKADALTGKIWVDVVTQELKVNSAAVAGDNAAGISNNFRGTEFDAGVKIDVANFEGVLYGYAGKGVGTTGLYVLATSASGDTRKSNGGYIQGTYKLDRLKVGLSYGISSLSLADDEEPGQINANPLLLRRNESGVVGLYYSLTKSVTLVGEYIDTQSMAHGGNETRERDYAIGGILFF
jgi:predicted porin